VPPLRWLADAATIMSTSLTEINWDRLIALAKQHGQVLPLRDSVGLFAAPFVLSSPCGRSENIAEPTGSRNHAMEYRIRTRTPRVMDGLLEIYLLTNPTPNSISHRGYFAHSGGSGIPPTRFWNGTALPPAALCSFRTGPQTSRDDDFFLERVAKL